MPDRVRHPTEVALLAVALGHDDVGPETREHVAVCPRCVRRRDELLAVASAVGRLHEFERDLAEGPTEERLDVRRGGRSSLEELAASSDAALEVAERLLADARHPSEDLDDRVRRVAEAGAGRLALLYAAQRGAILAADLPHRALALAEAIDNAGKSSIGSGHPGPTVSNSVLIAEARLLASQALLNIGRLPEASCAVEDARAAFSDRPDPFSRALCDYFEGSVLCFQGRFPRAERLLKGAARVFAEFGQDHWLGRAEGVLAQLLLQRGDRRRALVSFDVSLEMLDAERDATAFAAVLLNRAHCLSLLGSFEEARQSLAQALQLTRRQDMEYLAFGVRQGLADLEFLRGDLEKALVSYGALADEADKQGFEEDQIFERLCAAECLGRLGRHSEMLKALRDLGRRVAVTDLAGNAAWVELAARIDPGDVDLGLVSRVREHLSAAREGFVLPFHAERRA